MYAARRLARADRQEPRLEHPWAAWALAERPERRLEPPWTAWALPQPRLARATGQRPAAAAAEQRGVQKLLGVQRAPLFAARRQTEKVDGRLRLAAWAVARVLLFAVLPRAWALWVQLCLLFQALALLSAVLASRRRPAAWAM